MCMYIMQSTIIIDNDEPSSVKREMLVAIIFGVLKISQFSKRFNLEILLEESGWVHIFFIW